MTRKMKDSGIEWIGEIPEEWVICRHKNVMSKVKALCEHYNNEDIISLTMNGVIVRDLNGGGKMPATFDGYQYVEPQDLLLCLFDIDVTPRCVGLVKNYGITSPAYSRFVVKKSLYPAYFDYLLRTIDDKKVFVHLAKNLRSSLTEDDFGALPTIVPPLLEQRRIAHFLDAECAKIDRLIDQTRASIEEYKKLKHAMITEAVTKGVRGKRKMKDSGIEWIGEIPEEWGVCRGKSILTILERPVIVGDEVVTCFRDGEVTLRTNRREEGFTFSSQEIGYQGVEAGDLVVHGMDGFAGAIGISDSRGKASPVLNVIDSKQNKKYLMYYLRSVAYSGLFLSLSTGIRVRSCDTNWNKLKNILYLIPEINEQQEISTFLDKTLVQIDNHVDLKEKVLATLLSYKKSLIYEYVTGKKEVTE